MNIVNNDAEFNSRQETWIRAINNSGSTLKAGQLVSVTGMPHDYMLQIESTIVSPQGVTGVVSEDTPTGSEAYVTMQGRIRTSNNITYVDNGRIHRMGRDGRFRIRNYNVI